VYDRYPGGLGFALKAFELLDEIMEASLDLIDRCACSGGCPSCVGSPLPPFSQLDPDVNARGMIPDKEAAKSILHALLNKEPFIPSKREVNGAAAKIEEQVPLPEAKPLPVPLEKKLRERVGKLKRMRSPRPGQR
jgi:DEAD/DEAH box helicase domain-containing protein